MYAIQKQIQTSAQNSRVITFYQWRDQYANVCAIFRQFTRQIGAIDKTITLVILGALAKLRKATVSFVMSLRHSS